jgi:hypothetical protein
MTYPPGGQPDQPGYQPNQQNQPQYPAREYQGLQGYQQQQSGYGTPPSGFHHHQQQPYFAPPPPPPKPKRSPTLWIVVGVTALIIAGGATWGVIALNKSDTPAAQPTSTGSPNPTSETSPTTGRPTSQAPSGETKVITAPDGKTELTVPDSWEEIPEQFQNEVAVIQQGDQRKEQYAMVIPANKSDYNDFAGFVGSAVEDIKTSLDDVEVGAEEQVTIGDLKGAQYEVSASVTGTKIVYWFTMVEGKNGFYQVVGWTLPSRKSQAEPPIQEVIASFRER